MVAMRLDRCFGTVLGVVTLLGIALPLHAQSPFSPTASNLNAANSLIALPWPGLVDAKLQPFRKHLADISGEKFVNTSGNGYEFSLALDNLRLETNAAALAPGLVAFSNGVSVHAPATGSWSFAIAGNLAAHAWAGTKTTVGRTTVKTNLIDQDVSVPFVLGIDDVSFAANSGLDTSDPARPKLVSGAVQAHARVGGTVFFPGDAVDIDLIRRPDGSLAGDVSLTKPLGIPDFVEVDEGVTLSIILLPFSTDDTWTLIVALEGALFVHFPDPVGRIQVPSAPFFTMPLVLPANKLFGGSVANYMGLARGPVPLTWPPAGSAAAPVATVQVAPGASIDFATPRDTIEAGIASTHMPYNAVLSLDTQPLNPNVLPVPRPGTSQPTIRYAIDADSTIWTGHYLAAESFRYATTHDSKARDRVLAAIKGLQSDFEVTTDAAIENNQYVAVPSVSRTSNAPDVPQRPDDEAGFIFARSTIPHTSQSGSTLPDWSDTVDGRIKAGVCLYAKPSGGWRIERIGGATDTTTYPTYAAARAGQGISLGNIRPVDSIAQPISYGSGCGNRGEADNPISRDQYSGIFMGLAYAYSFVPEAQAQARKLVDGALDYVLLNNWNVPLPPDRTIVTSFMGDFDAQLFLLRVGATVDPTHVPHGTSQSYQQLYARFAPASALCWLPEWLSATDPLTSYFKYNLSHSFLGVTLFLETDATLRANYLAAYNIMRAVTANHRNAYFNLMDILVKAASASSPSAANPSLSLGQETTSDLADWVTRWKDVKAPDGMPTNATSSAASDFIVSLWPTYIQLYASLADPNKPSRTTTFPVPLPFRPGAGMEFVWQVSPWRTGIDSPGTDRKVTPPGPVAGPVPSPVPGPALAAVPGSAPVISSTPGGPVALRPTSNCSTTPPSARQIALCSSEPYLEGPGVDFLLPYWLGVYLNVWPAN
ncbi:MAG: hypothetical protein ACRD59_03015 [Candidatus Acidiferrales bacterium]